MSQAASDRLARVSRDNVGTSEERSTRALAVLSHDRATNGKFTVGQWEAQDMSIFAGIGVGLLAFMFLPVVIALLRGRFLVAFVVLFFVMVSVPALIHPFIGIAIWLVALCISAFAGSRKVIIAERPR
jgi:hypothetical protein